LSVKITTEKLPKSLLSLQIELEKERLERGLDQAARRLSQKYPIHGFRPGKAPRFMIERTFGRDALIEEASDDLINKAFRDALKQEGIAPVGQAALQSVTSNDPFSFTIHIPVQPTVDIGDYRALRAPLDLAEMTDEQLERALDVMRDRHVVLKELDEPRPAQDGDQLKVKLDTIVDGAPLNERSNAEEAPEQTLDLVKGRLVDELYDGMLGANVGDTKEISATMPDDHGNEQVRGKAVVFKVEILSMQERLLPDWEELPTLEEFEGTLEELRAKTRSDLEVAARNAAERKSLDSYVDQLVAQTSYDIPDVMVSELAHELLRDQERQFSRYGITMEQMLQYRGQTHEQAVEALLPDAERQTRITLALREVVGHEGLKISQAELQTELSRLLLDYNESERASVAQTLQTQMLNNVASAALDRKLRERLVAIAVGEAPALEGSVAPAAGATEGAEVEMAEVAVVEPEAAEAEAAEPAVKAVE